MILSDGYIANGAEPWRIPEVDSLPKIPVSHPAGRKQNGEPFLPYKRDENLARPWAIPGTEGLMHRVGGLEKEDGTGNVSYDPDNHQHMVETRANKVAKAAEFLDPLEVDGPDSGTLVLSWGGTYGSCRTAVKACQENGKSVAHAHLRWINPFPSNLGEVLTRFDNVLIPELNTGQLRLIIRDKYLIDAKGFNKIKGKPFSVTELIEAIEAIC
jgi:2-oxoglutarate ferredoxin oxidoreductase subunit alpha